MSYTASFSSVFWKISLRICNVCTLVRVSVLHPQVATRDGLIFPLKNMDNNYCYLCVQNHYLTCIQHLLVLLPTYHAKGTLIQKKRTIYIFIKSNLPPRDFYIAKYERRHLDFIAFPNDFNMRSGNGSFLISAIVCTQ